MSSEKTLAENEATARLVAIRKTTRLFILGLTATVALIGLTVLWTNYSQEPKPIAAQQSSTGERRKMLAIQPGGKSERIPVPFHMRVTMAGKDYRHHCVYADGHEESFVSGERPCASGDMPFVYATNLRPHEPNVVTYFYEK